jgi:hypothetical protein
MSAGQSEGENKKKGEEEGTVYHLLGPSRTPKDGEQTQGQKSRAKECRSEGYRSSGL